MNRPGKIVCVGRNYREHAKELGNDVPTAPLLFLKPPSAVIAPGVPIVMPKASQRVDFEGEVGVVIGTTLRRATPAQCTTGIRGVVALNDVTARDLQKSDGQWTRGKGFDTFCPIGPLSTGVPPLDAITVVTRVNGEEKQRASSAEMVFSIPELLSYISHVMTLEPGDVVATGTPAGIAPLQPGDVVEVELVGLSIVRNPVEAEA
ncbi:MAG: fumarylacetoacetate hydrolase family protein [Candidatus Omnitrophota bacterium]|jgi:2-keto-4-pentenoate hydratase/2-oxohepta-3-ene-1,7-dioic acid hydratase in catechol pathway